MLFLRNKRDSVRSDVGHVILQKLPRVNLHTIREKLPPSLNRAYIPVDYNLFEILR